MTLILLANGKYHSIIASDRRLTANGRLVDSAANKAIVLQAPGYRLLFGFTGLAEAGRYKTRKVLTDAISSLAPTCPTIEALIRGLRDVFDNEFRNAPVRNIREALRSLAIGFVGAVISGQQSKAVYGSIMNIDHFGESKAVGSFKMQGHITGRGLGVLGARSAVSEADEQEILALIDRDAPHGVIAGKMADRIRVAAAKPQASGTVGDMISWAAINRRTLAVEFGQYPQSTLESSSPTFIFVDMWGEVSTVEGISVIGPEAKYKLPFFERGQPCPCGGGAQYRRCHGRKFERHGGVPSPITTGDDPLIYPPGYESWGQQTA
ncbi:YecA family protein [Mesorhizobium helmanticense]|uniref:SEC-C domain-containing protein n=1 Tax=Mesorhizobium helmanticense TaxID=1776423 RepID=A0A2T4IP42_9HYPH|nr:SEC-C domain-containing protein [Mesorhizobium helmanticense]PTE07389.1 hypothetical protein C9427_27200 [Mesorhizobium helmanticense]